MALTRPELRDLLTQYRRQNWQGIQTAEWQRKIVDGMLQEDDDDGHPALLKRIAAHWTLPPDPVILDLGSGVGNFVVACRQRGLRAFGVEPDRIGNGSSLTSLQIAGKRLDSCAFAAAIGEQLPFRDAAFDLVVMNQVIEHVNDQESILAEALRVVKPGGAIYIACPNYLRFYEPHYKLWFLPLMPKRLGAWYLRIRGRDPVLLHQLNYTTNWKLRRLLRNRRQRIVDLNGETFVAKSGAGAGAFASRKARIVARLIGTPGLGKMILASALFYIRLREGGSEILAFADA